ncbi:unnamed protein product [Adineta steineri]|uniref:HhH-GPD domain-containing protein n=1 Tax=Adineta steineri TaxID=433720 RepID=A0A819NZL5_9BILA|nr:unnamed protein product [Adineta steineri]
MPWKGEKDAYKVWLSEIILQQTRVEQGWKYYENFIQNYPTIIDLANAKDEAVFKLWEGLGYYSRCKNLLFTASLKGIGNYTASAIASFCFNLPHAVVDGNVLRVLSRYFGIEKAVDTTDGKQFFSKLADECLDKNQPAEYNQSIMDFGATVCKPVPLCTVCVMNKTEILLYKLPVQFLQVIINLAFLILLKNCVMKKASLILFVSVLFFMQASTQIKLPDIISDSMVLQQNTNAPLWGWTKAGEKVEVSGSWANKIVQTITDKTGKWMVKLATPKAGGPYNVTIKASETRVLHGVLIGEVWICSGQSNMEMPLCGFPGAPVKNSAQEIASANFPQIRLFTAENQIAFTPQQNVKGKWASCSPASVDSFSAAAYFFGRELFNHLHVPIGLMNVNWGGTVAEAWTSETALRTMPYFNKQLDQVDTAAKRTKQMMAKDTSGLTAWKKTLSANNPNEPSVLFDGMIAPVIPFAIKGAIWYQGEANVGRAKQYETLFPLLISDWRKQWNEQDFPFYFVQIAPYDHSLKDSTLAGALRDAQRKTLYASSNTGMVVTLDIGERKNIHPSDKQDVGKRLAFWALNKTYGVKDIAYSGPLYKNMQINGNKIIVSFTNTDGGLTSKNKTLQSFEVAGADSVWKPASATIEGDKVIVTSNEVSNPVAVRYAFYAYVDASLFNGKGLPASSFTSQ